jgi:hypothetical protein
MHAAHAAARPRWRRQLLANFRSHSVTFSHIRSLDGDFFPRADVAVPSSLPLSNDFELSGQRLLAVTEEELQRLVLEGLRGLLSTEPDMRIVATATDGD